MFRRDHFPPVVMNPQDANVEFIRDNVELVPIGRAEGRIAAEGALPYPPGVLCVVPGEVWGGAAQRYSALEEGINRLPGFSPELQGSTSRKRSRLEAHLRLYDQAIEKGRFVPAPSFIHAERVTFCGSSSARYSLSPDSGATRRPDAWWSAFGTRRPAACR